VSLDIGLSRAALDAIGAIVFIKQNQLNPKYHP